MCIRDSYNISQPERNGVRDADDVAWKMSWFESYPYDRSWSSLNLKLPQSLVKTRYAEELPHRFRQMISRISIFPILFERPSFQALRAVVGILGTGRNVRSSLALTSDEQRANPFPFLRRLIFCHLLLPVPQFLSLFLAILSSIWFSWKVRFADVAKHLINLFLLLTG